jgi:two-component system sensor histidine kinase AgrC
MIEREAEITSIYRNEIKDMQRDIFDFKHDYVKIYSSMSAFIINEEYDKLSEFFDKNIAPLQKELFDMDEDSRSLGLIEDGAVQGLVYSYIIKAKKVGVTILTDIREPVPTVSVPVLDLNRLLGIFLDNAIEQAAQNGSEVGFAAIPDEDSVLFVITNRAEGVDIERMFNRGESTKGNGRGRGLAIARKLCSAHDDLSLHTYIKDKKFICEIYADL